MSLARVAAAAKPLPDSDRRAHIIAAAERAFVKYGFHAATMQQVAEEAGMSAGNLYRYFPSKEAIVEELCALDQAERAESFVRLMQGSDLRAAMVATFRDHVVRRPPEKARMIVEIWSEASRNPRVAELTRRLDEDVMQGIQQLVEAAKPMGVAAASVDARFAARVVFTLVSGLFKRIALEPGFDPEAEGAMALGVLRAVFTGALAPAQTLES
jgi:TetR/AcrR family transcriptional repressor of uid operon